MEQKKQKKKIYSPPELKVVEFEVEHGYAASIPFLTGGRPNTEAFEELDGDIGWGLTSREEVAGHEAFEEDGVIGW